MDTEQEESGLEFDNNSDEEYNSVELSHSDLERNYRQDQGKA